MISQMVTSRRFFLALTGAYASLPLAAWSGDAPRFIAEYERASGGRAGFFARNLESGAQISWRADERFAMCSTFKASLAALVLSRVDAGREALDRAIPFGPSDIQPYAPAARKKLAAGSMTLQELCEAAVVLSDNTCANLLLREVGGPHALTAFWRRIGDGSSRLDHKEPQLNRTRPGNPQDTTTPAAMATTVERLVVGDVLSSKSREQLVEWLVGCKTGLDKLRAGMPADWRIGDKTGNNGADASGDIAIAWPSRGGAIVIAAYVQGGHPRAEQQAALLASIGKFAAENLAGR